MDGKKAKNQRPPHTRDLAGLRIGRMTVSHVHGIARDGHLTWLCLCDCGKEKVVSSNSITRAIPVQSCGCLNKDRAQIKRRSDGPWNDGKSYVISSGEHCYKTRHGWARAAIKHYGNRCERCGWNQARCDVHHRNRKALGGTHTLANAIVLCPNCHRVEHQQYP